MIMGFKEDVEKHMEKEYPELHPPKKEIPQRKKFMIHIPEQTVYEEFDDLEEATLYADEVYSGYDEITEIKGD
jgi:hypothetical protein